MKKTIKTAPTNDIRFECTQCGQRLVVEPAGAGMSMDCPICNISVIVPTLEESKAAHRGHRRQGLGTAMTPIPSRSPYAEPLPEEPVESAESKSPSDREEIARLQQQLKAVAEEREHLNANTTHTLAELKAFQTERQQLKADLSVVRQRLSAVEEDLGSAVRRGDDWKAKAAVAEQALAVAKKTVEARAAEVQAGELALKKSRNTLAGIEHELAAVRQELEGEGGQRGRIAADLEDTRRDLSDAQEMISLYERELHVTRTRLAEVEAEFSESQTLATSLDAQRSDLQLRLDEAQPRLVEADEVKAHLARTTTTLDQQNEKLRLAEESVQSLTMCCTQLRHEGDSLRRDLAESHAGREILEVRDQLDASKEEGKRLAARVAALEGEVRTITSTEAATRADLERARQERDDAIRKGEAFRESRSAKDNDVLRGIIDRLNAELVQRTGEVVRLKRARIGLKTAYVLFALGGLGVVAFAIKVLPHALKF